MKIAMTSKGNDLEAEVDTRFGRCVYFLIVDPDTMEFEAMSNESASASGGAGPQAAQAISEKGVEVLITGNVGPKAFVALEAGRVAVYIGATGTVEEALGELKQGTLRLADGANVDGHWT